MSIPIDLCRVPAVQIPGKTPNLDNPDTLGPAIVAVMTITTAWALLFTATRFYSNIRKLSWSDYCAAASVICSIVLFGIMSTQLRTARHIWDMPACYFSENYAITMWLQSFFVILGLFFAKSSIFLLFNQIFMVQEKMRIAIWVGMVFNFLSHASAIIVSTVLNTPRGTTWIENMNTRAPKGMKFWQAHIVWTVALDIFIFVLPLPAISRLNISKRQRISLIAVFSLALMGIGASIASLVERFLIMKSVDSTWISAVLNLCGAVELNVAIIVASAVGFSGFLRSHLPKLYSALGGSKPVTPDLEAGFDEKDREIAAPAQGGTIGGGQPKFDRRREERYYNLDDSWMLKSDGTVDQKSGVRTVSVGEGSESSEKS